MNVNAIRIWLAAGMIGSCLAGGVQAMGDPPPDDEARPAWVRPGDVIADERSVPDTAVPQPDAAPEGPQIFFTAEGEPGDWQWKARVVVVFANTAQDPAFTRQMQALESGAGALDDRDTVVVIDTDPAGNSAWRRVLRPEGFSLVLIDKDGTVMLRKPVPWGMREISRAIDRLALRRQEVGRSGTQ